MAENGNGTLQVKTPFGEVSARGGLVILVIIGLVNVGVTIMLARLMRTDQEHMISYVVGLKERQQVIVNAVTRFCKGAEGLQVEFEDINRKEKEQERRMK
jgi:hypothetical protein